jgi:hypothetical protein
MSLPASIINSLGRSIAMTCPAMFVIEADFPAPVGPKISPWAFFFLSLPLKGSKRQRFTASVVHGLSGVSRAPMSPKDRR